MSQSVIVYITYTVNQVSVLCILASSFVCPKVEECLHAQRLVFKYQNVVLDHSLHSKDIYFKMH